MPVPVHYLRLALLALVLMLPALALAQDDAAEWVFIENESLRVGVKKSSGGGIGWISPAGSQQNLINHFDRGRLVQQSYYGEADGSLWNKQPWRWNPVQGGDWKGTGAKLLELKSTKDTLDATTLPKHWASGKDLDECRMQQNLRLDGNLLRVHYRFDYTGTVKHPRADQELPAIFLQPEFDQLVLYSGAQPFEGKELSKSKPGWPNDYKPMTEHWAAYVDKAGFGLGAYVPAASKLTCYRFGNGDAAKGACSYFAPLAQFAIEPGLKWEYELIITLGSVEEIRARFKKLH
ncbi:hypothetical protein NA78x_005213 [Anatilimnocola sp. NA78]|uniref:hypothetical protein n=1 Tax=Anatilimnocola sp. NA78 TaxID=3415683 RepID=UPI003CE4A32E